MTFRRCLKTKSGRPGKSLAWSRYRYPRAKTSLRTKSSGREFFDRNRAMISDRSERERLSTLCILRSTKRFYPRRAFPSADAPQHVSDHPHTNTIYDVEKRHHECTVWTCRIGYLFLAIICLLFALWHTATRVSANFSSRDTLPLTTKAGQALSLPMCRLQIYFLTAFPVVLLIRPQAEKIYDATDSPQHRGDSGNQHRTYAG